MTFIITVMLFDVMSRLNAIRPLSSLQLESVHPAVQLQRAKPNWTQSGQLTL